MVSGQRQAEILERLEKPTDEKPDEQADVWEGQPVVEPGSQDGSWTFGMHQLMKGRRFSVELPDQYTLIPDSDGRRLARYTQGIEDQSECPEINLRRLHELELFCEGAADADVFCECIAAVANMLNLSNNERMNANLWRAVRASNNTSAALLANHGMQRIQAEAYNAGLNEAVTYYGLFVRALENQAELGTEGLGRMIDVVERYADVFIVDYVTIDGDEEGTKTVNELGIISIPLAYETLRGRLAAVKDANEASSHLSLSSLTEAIAECADSDGYCDYQRILDKTGDTSTPEEVNALLEQCWRDGLLRMRMTGSETRYALRWSDDEWHEVRDEENARFDAEQEVREKQNQLEHHRRMEQEIAARKTSLDAI